jgi:hypothetical protein
MDIEIIKTKRVGRCQSCDGSGPLAKVSITIEGVAVPTFFACTECCDLMEDFA